MHPICEFPFGWPGETPAQATRIQSENINIAPVYCESGVAPSRERRMDQFDEPRHARLANSMMFDRAAERLKNPGQPEREFELTRAQLPQPDG